VDEYSDRVLGVWAGTVTAQEVEVQGCGGAGEFCVLEETLESPETVGNESSDPTEKRLDPINQYGDNNSLGQVTNVSQLRDVQPSDWAYTALRSLLNDMAYSQGILIVHSGAIGQ